MATRPKGYGFSAEVHRKIAAKYEIDKEQEARLWIEAVLGEPLDPEVPQDEHLGPDRFHECLKDGTVLCKLASTVMNRPVKINNSKMAFKQMENISTFLQACEDFGCNRVDLFQTADLYDKTNLWQVVLTIHALGRKAQANGYDGPVLGPKEASKNVRQFTDEQMKAGNGIIGLQMGQNKGASQKGISFGQTRHIADMKVDSASREGQATIGLQMGTNKGASQSGINMGKTRSILD